MIRKISVLFLTTTMLVNCSKQDVNRLANETKNYEVSKGVVSFSSQKEMVDLIEEMKKDETFFGNTLKEMYKKGFRSISPVGEIETDPELISIFGTYNEPNVQVEEQVKYVSDPFFSALLNENNQIIINDTLYQFTHKGLFYSHIKDTLEIKSYLEDNVLNREPDFEEIYYLKNNFMGITKVNERIFRFIPQQQEKDPSPVLQSYVTSVDDVTKIAMGLPKRDTHKNWFLHNIFGRSEVAEEYFDKRNRVKIEFYDQNYLVYKSKGVSVRNQVRRLRIWWATKADEVVIGINYGYFKYTKPAPVEFKLPQVDFNYKSPYPYYAVNGGIFYQDGRIINDLKLEKIKLPIFEIDNEHILSFYIPPVPVILENGEMVDLSTGLLTEEHNVKNLYKFGINLLKSQATGSRPFVAVRDIYTQPKEYEVLLLNSLIIKESERREHYIFNRDVNLMLGVNWTSPGNEPLKPNFIYDYNFMHTTLKEVKISFYGMARRGEVWKGVQTEVKF